MRVSVAATLQTALTVLLLATTAPRAQVPTTIDPTINYAFSSQLGSGIYRVDERTVQIYRLSFSLLLRDPEERGWGLRLRFPFTFGFFNFKIDDILDQGIPNNLGTLTLVPTLEFEVPRRDNWWLGPFLGVGVGKDFSGGQANGILATGIRSMAIWPWKEGNIRLTNRLVYSISTEPDLEFSDDFGLFETGVDFRRPLGPRVGGYAIDGSIFVANYLYLVSPNIVRFSPDPIEFRSELEIGTTFGTTTAWRVLGIQMPRLGVSYRFGSGADAIRFVIGNPFPIDSLRDQGAAVN